MVAVGTAVFSTAAILTGSLHYKASEKKLIEEGVSQSARRAALPLASRALLSSTLGCAAVGVIATIGYTMLGGEHKDRASVASWSAVVESARSGAQLVRNEFHKRLDDTRPSRNDDGTDR
jgi:hypothetical protein